MPLIEKKLIPPPKLGPKKEYEIYAIFWPDAPSDAIGYGYHNALIHRIFEKLKSATIRGQICSEDIWRHSAYNQQIAGLPKPHTECPIAKG